MSILVIDALSGCSGDMFVAALSVLCDKTDEISALPAKLGFDHVHVEWTDVQRSSLACKKCDFIVSEHKDGHEHHTHADHHHDHHHRHLSDIHSIIAQADVPAGCKQRAADIFQRLGEVEAAAHGIPLEKVHFHEVGAIDSIMDIVATAYLLDALHIQKAYCSTICVGHGQVKTAHGLLPIPAPATERLLHNMLYMPGHITWRMVHTNRRRNFSPPRCRPTNPSPALSTICLWRWWQRPRRTAQCITPSFSTCRRSARKRNCYFTM